VPLTDAVACALASARSENQPPLRFCILLSGVEKALRAGAGGCSELARFFFAF